MDAKWSKQEKYNHDEGTEVILGDRIKQLRKERRWSQAELAAKVGADAAQISRYENGHMSPSAEAVVKLAETLEVSTDYLLVDGVPRRALHRSGDRLGDHLRDLDELSDDDLNALLSVLDGLVAKTRLKALVGGLG